MVPPVPPKSLSLLYSTPALFQAGCVVSSVLIVVRAYVVDTVQAVPVFSKGVLSRQKDVVPLVALLRNLHMAFSIYAPAKAVGTVRASDVRPNVLIYNPW